MAQSRFARPARKSGDSIGTRLLEQLQVWRRWPASTRSDGSDGVDDEPAQRASSDATTLPPPSRGQALREAYRTLRARMNARPAMRQVLPHLAAIERGLGRHGSRALRKLPVPVLHRGLTQLTLLQVDDEAPLDAANLRVLRLRLIEAIALRTAPLDGGEASVDPAARTPRRGDASAPRGFAPSSRLGASTHTPGMEVSEVPAEMFDEAERTISLARPH